MKLDMHNVKWRFVAISLFIVCAPGIAFGKQPSYASPGHVSKEQIAESAHPSPALTSKDVRCIEDLLQARSTAEVHLRFHECRMNPPLRMSLAYMLTKFRAPDAVKSLIGAIPKSDREMHQLYEFSGSSELASAAYEGYYYRLFLLGRTDPQILPRLFAIAAAYGSDNPNVDEYVWFCDDLKQIYDHAPHAYMKAVKQTKNILYRNHALTCRAGTQF